MQDETYDIDIKIYRCDNCDQLHFSISALGEQVVFNLSQDDALEFAQDIIDNIDEEKSLN